jgi:hypothetical protein
MLGCLNPREVSVSEGNYSFALLDNSWAIKCGKLNRK